MKASLQAFQYVRTLVRFSFIHYPLFYFSIFLGLVSAGIELFAMVTLYPLSILATGGMLAETNPFMIGMRFIGWAPTEANFLLLFCIGFSAQILSNLASQGLFMYLSRVLCVGLATHAFEVILKKMQLREVEEKPIGAFIGIVNDESLRAGELMTRLCHFTHLFMLCLLYYAAIFYQSWLVGSIITLFLICVFFCLIGPFRQLHRLGQQRVAQVRDVHSLFVEGLNGLRSIRAFLAETFIAKGYRRCQYILGMTYFRIDLLLQCAKQIPVLLLLFLAMGMVYFDVVHISRDTDFAFIVTLLFFLIRFFPALGNCFNTLLHVISDAKSGQDVTAFIAITEKADKHTPLSKVPVGFIEKISFDRATFCHGTRPIFKDLSFELLRGNSYALVGPSGVGKSTVADCLLVLQTLYSGHIFINNMPLDQYMVSSVRQQIGLIGQQTTILNETVFANVAFGRPASLEQVRAVCQIAGIDETILALPQGYDTILHYQGNNLSGGQKQRIGIARGLLSDAQVLILDESTSGLDPGVRATVVQSILTAYRDRVVLFITHDPWICTCVDTVISLAPIPVFAQAEGLHYEEK